MPTVAKSTSKISKLGDLSTFGVSTAAIPTDTSDSSGALPTFNVTLANGTDTEYLVGESLSLAGPAIGSYTGDIVSYSKAKKSAQFTLSAESMLSRMNIDLRTYPLSDYNGITEYPLLPIYTLEYWTQQCGIFYTAVPGNVLFYQSGYGHFGAFGKNIVRPLRSSRYPAVSGGSNGITIGVGDRVYTGLGRGFTAAVNFPAPVTGTKADAYLPLMVPAVASQKLVFGIDVGLTGPGNSGTVTWNMVTPDGKTNPMTLSLSADSGIQLQVMQDGVLTTILTASVPNRTIYSVYVGLSGSGAGVKFDLKAVSSAGVVVASSSTTVTTALTGSLSLRKITYYGNLGGAGDEIYVANHFISLMADLPAGTLPTQKSLAVGYKGSAFMVGFSGNAWEHVKQFCSIYHLDVSYQNGKLTIGPRQKDVKVGASLSELTTSVSRREQARNVEVVNQNHKATGPTPTVMWAADSVYQVAVGETQEFLVQTEHSILETSQPVCVSGISPYPYKSGVGQYVVTGSDGYIVSPTFWRDQGGKITTATTENEGEIKITIKGPDFDSPRAPYRISEGDAGRPALYVTGLGILAAPETLKVGTGNGSAAKDVGVTIDSPFIGNAKLAYDAAARAAKVFSSPEVSISIAEPLLYDEASKLGAYPSGSLVKHEGNTFRVKSANQTPSVLTGDTEQHNTLYQVNRSFGAGATIAQQNAFYAGKTIGQVNIKPLKKVN
jgi:hypothetical protein